MVCEAHRDGVAEGDLLFGNRQNLTQSLNALVGDPWSHVAIAARYDGELRVIELGPHGCSHRSIDEFWAAYRAVGVARPAMHPLCRRTIADWPPIAWTQMSSTPMNE